ncbi:unnamed protein product [Ostreobium quekettii]|uniref:JmjC domain-containing protein n=1 Tax=Ostreobium quekettii TaxID=121088 RepID=A0A8S1JCN5_9CHLO|nr:unnamed protein product [Ostreobium quekettii]|eukprot:evm.model.scf_372EXC.1 EVM.evm.TU.scf_372EXC.1   scf_372EXC:18823-32151(-)
MGSQQEAACSTVPFVDVTGQGHPHQTGTFKDVLERLGVNNILGVRGGEEPGTASQEDTKALKCEVAPTTAENRELGGAPSPAHSSDQHGSGDTKENRGGSFLDQFLVRDAATFQAQLLQRSSGPFPRVGPSPLSASESDGQPSAERVESLSQWLPVSPCAADTPTSALAGTFHFRFPRDPTCLTDPGTTSTFPPAHVLADLPKPCFGTEHAGQPHAPSSKHSSMPMADQGLDHHLPFTSQQSWTKAEEGPGRSVSRQFSNGYLLEALPPAVGSAQPHVDPDPSQVVWPFSNDLRAPNRDPWLPPSTDSDLLAMMQVVGPLGWSSLTGAPLVTAPVAEDGNLAGKSPSRRLSGSGSAGSSGVGCKRSARQGAGARLASLVTQESKSLKEWEQEAVEARRAAKRAQKLEKRIKRMARAAAAVACDAQGYADRLKRKGRLPRRAKEIMEAMKQTMDTSQEGRLTRGFEPGENLLNGRRAQKRKQPDSELESESDLEESMECMYGCPSCDFNWAGCPKCLGKKPLAKRPEARCKPKQARTVDVPCAPIYRPAQEEFSDPMAYIAKIRPEAEKYGICMIVPPDPWEPPFNLKEELEGIKQDFKFCPKLQSTNSLCVRPADLRSPQSSRPSSDTGSSPTVTDDENDEDDEDDVFGFAQLDEPHTLKSFLAYANWAKAAHFSSRPTNQADEPTSGATNWTDYPSVSDVEGEFWRILGGVGAEEEDEEEVEALYGSDLDSGALGSGFPWGPEPEDEAGGGAADRLRVYRHHPWNINRWPLCRESVLKHVVGEEPITGVMVPWLYVGSCLSAFCWHIEDHALYSVNYMHTGAPKVWYGVPGEAAGQFEAAMRDALPHLFEVDTNLLHRLVTHLSPVELQARGVPVARLEQRPGNFVLTFPNAYHGGLNCGFNVAEAVNFAPPDWLPHGSDAVLKYRRQGRKPTFSHDALLLSLATAAGTDARDGRLGAQKASQDRSTGAFSGGNDVCKGGNGAFDGGKDAYEGGSDASDGGNDACDDRNGAFGGGIDVRKDKNGILGGGNGTCEGENSGSDGRGDGCERGSGALDRDNRTCEGGNGACDGGDDACAGGNGALDGGHDASGGGGGCSAGGGSAEGAGSARLEGRECAEGGGCGAVSNPRCGVAAVDAVAEDAVGGRGVDGSGRGAVCANPVGGQGLGGGAEEKIMDGGSTANRGTTAGESGKGGGEGAPRGVCALAIKYGIAELDVRIEQEARRRGAARGVGVEKERRMTGGLHAKDGGGVHTDTTDVDCGLCKADLHLSSVVSPMAPGIAVCPDHAAALPGQRILLYRHTLDELRSMVSSALTAFPDASAFIRAAQARASTPSSTSIRALGPLYRPDDPGPPVPAGGPQCPGSSPGTRGPGDTPPAKRPRQGARAAGDDLANARGPGPDP